MTRNELARRLVQLRRTSSQVDSLRIARAGWAMLLLMAIAVSTRLLSAQVSTALTLREIATFRVPVLPPARFDVTSGIMLGDTAVALIARAQGRALLVSEGSLTLICPETLRAPIAIRARAGGITALDATHRLVHHRGGSNANCTSRAVGLREDDTILDAVALQSGWLLAVKTADAKSLFVRIDDVGREDARWPAADRSGDALMQSQSLLSAAYDSAISSSTVWPFQWTIIGPAGPSAIQFSPPSTNLPLGSRPSAASTEWLGLRTVALDNGFLQVIAERSGERRVLVLYDRRGRFVRATELQGAFGLLQSTPNTSRLLALRRTGSTEAVIYEWGWGAEEQPF